MTATELDPATELDLIKTEYEALKKEQVSRIRDRDNFVYVAYAVIALIVGGASTIGSLLPLLAIGPAVANIGWKYLMNDRKIVELGRHIDTVLSPRVFELTGVNAFPWEQRDTGPTRDQRHRIQLYFDLGTFCVPGLLGLLTISDLPLDPRAAAVGLAAGLSLATSLLMGSQFIRYYLIDHAARR